MNTGCCTCKNPKANKGKIEQDFSMADDNTYLQKNGEILFGYRLTGTWKEQ